MPTQDKASLWASFVAPGTQEPLKPREDGLYSRGGGLIAPIVDGIAEFVCADEQAHFGLRWNRFAAVQLDSVNGTTESRDRLLDQSGLSCEDFADKTVLEVGCGAGRFTEVLLGFGARVVSTDFSTAVRANRRTHEAAAEEGRVVFARANVFELPFAPRSFDIVLCYGVVQHTSDADTALRELWERVAAGGVLLVDRYRAAARNVMPMKYILRPVTKRLASERLLKAIDGGVSWLFPHEVALLRRLQGPGLQRAARLVVNRAAPNSVFPANLLVQGQLDEKTALSWSILDTFDMYGPRYDMPQTFRAWRRDVADLPEGRVERCVICGHGNTATVRRQSSFVTSQSHDMVGHEYWTQLWTQMEVPDPVDPRSKGVGNLFNRRLHRQFQMAFDGSPTSGADLLEIGCGRSAWLPYFAKEFGFRITGLDYSELGCEQEREILRKAGLPGTVVCADLFEPPAQLRNAFDVVFSLGVIEHFRDTPRCLRACADLLRPGGRMLTVIPNMTGVPGRLQRFLDREVYNIHVPLTSRALEDAHLAAGLAIRSCKYFLSTGWGILRVESAGGLTRFLLRGAEASSVLVWLLEDHLRQLPASGLFSPLIVCEAQRPIPNAPPLDC